MKSFIILLMLFIAPIFADVNSDMSSFFNSLGMASNVTTPNVYQGQEAGYYSGGSLYLRSPNKDLQFAQITAPSISAGCGGIDLFMGGFSFINSQQLIQFAQNMLSEAAPVAFNIALQTMSPTLSNIFQNFETFANMINGANLNSCQADYMVAGALTQGTAANQYACNDINSQGGEFEDWVSSHEGCASSPSSNYNNVNNNTSGKQEATVSKNLVWAALMQSSMYSDDPALAEFMMSLSGTIIYDANGNPTPYPPLALDQDMINGILFGGSVQTYLCNDFTNCLSPTVGTTTIQASSSFETQVSNDLNDILASYTSNQALTTNEEAFLTAVPYPILKYIEVSQSAHLSINLTQYADAIANSIMMNYLITSEETIQQALAETNFSQADLNKMDQNIAQTMSLLNQNLATDQTALSQMMSIVETYSDFNKQVVSGMSAEASSNFNFDPYGTTQP